MLPMHYLAGLAASAGLAGCSSGPDQLAKSLESAIAAGDGNAIVALARLERVPAQARFMLMDLPGDCGGRGLVCTVKAVPLDPEWVARNEAQGKQMGTEIPSPAGLLEVSGTEAKAPGSGNKMTMRVPYAEIDGKYCIVSARYTAAKLAELEATTAQQIADKFIADNPDWKTATALPADGGEAGAALRAKFAALADAVAKNDPDAAAAAYGWGGAALLGPKNSDDTPRTREQQLARLNARKLAFLTDLAIHGGWQNGDQALLVIEAKNGAGSVVRGVRTLERDGDGWVESGGKTVEIPAES
jgi:hypothetical protein